MEPRDTVGRSGELGGRVGSERRRRAKLRWSRERGQRRGGVPERGEGPGGLGRLQAPVEDGEGSRRWQGDVAAVGCDAGTQQLLLAGA